MTGRANIRIGIGSRLLRGASILADDGRVTIGRDSFIARWAVVQAAGGFVTIGNRSGIGDFCNLYGQGGLTIGDDVLMASGVRVMTADHIFDRRDQPIRMQGERSAPTNIENDVWLGANVCVLAGVTIGEGAICAAGAVITRDVQPFTVVAGVPARLVKERP
jgi:acetyltransferase-like isoleucine patch superfamily enzyme